MTILSHLTLLVSVAAVVVAVAVVVEEVVDVEEVETKKAEAEVGTVFEAEEANPIAMESSRKEENQIPSVSFVMETTLHPSVAI